MSKLISIIIPMFNEEDNISSCLENLYSQSSQDFHVIFVNDGSTDNTVKILSEQLSSNIPLFSYEILNQENLGAAKARETAINHSFSQYIVILDCDDKISSNYIKLIINNINIFPNIDIIMPDMKIETQNGYISFPFYSLKESLTGEECLEHSLGGWKVHGVTCSKKEILLKSYATYKKYNPNGQNYINNDEVITRLNFYYSDKIIRTDAVYFYQNNQESTTKKINSKRYLMCENAMIIYQLFGRNMGTISINTAKELVSVLWGTTVYLMKHKKQISNKETWKQELDKVYKYIEKNKISSQLLFKSKVQLFLSKLIHYVI